MGVSHLDLINWTNRLKWIAAELAGKPRKYASSSPSISVPVAPAALTALILPFADLMRLLSTWISRVGTLLGSLSCKSASDYLIKKLWPSKAYDEAGPLSLKQRAITFKEYVMSGRLFPYIMAKRQNTQIGSSRLASCFLNEEETGAGHDFH